MPSPVPVSLAGRLATLVVLLWGLNPTPAVAQPAQPTLAVSPTTVSVQANAGQSPAPQVVSVANAGSKALKWSVVQPTASWLSVSPQKGVNTGTLTLSFNTASLAANTYQTSFRVEATNGDAATVTVALTVVGVTVPTLSVTCPANRTVASPDGNPVAVTYSATTSGGQAPVTVVYAPTSGSSFALGTTPVTVTASSADGQQAACGFSVTVTYTAPPPTLTVTCPANRTVASPDGSPVVVSYSVSTSGGVAPIVVGGSPASGSSFPVGTTPVSVTATSADGQKAACGFSVTVTYTPPPPSSGIGPQPSISCPAGAVDIFPGTPIQGVVDQYPAATAYCLRAGVHSITRSTIPKTGDSFTGEYGAVIDGSGWITNDYTEGAFRAHEQDIDYVSIRNLVIRNMSKRAIHAFHNNSDHWTIENNELANNLSGLVFPADTILRNNYIHHNYEGGYLGASAHNSIIENNEIAYNGWEQKLGQSVNVVFRNNHVHHNAGDGIWFDNDNTGVLIEGNVVEDNGQMGIFYEISGDAIIRNNTIRRSGDTAVFISTSKNVEIYNNILDHNARGISYFINCHAIGGGQIGFDLSNNWAHDNTVTVGPGNDAFAAVFSWTLCDPSQLLPYETNTKNLRFTSNTYDVEFPTTGRYWIWKGLKYWSEWQALGLDLDSTVK